MGSIEVSLIKPSIGEILRTQWLAILASLFIHMLLWLAYRAVARPSRSEYLARINNESRLKHEIQQLTQALELEKHNSALMVAQVQQQAKAQPLPKARTAETTSDNDQRVALNIQFYDPKQLLSSVNQSVSVPYFKLCQIFLNKVLSCVHSIIIYAVAIWKFDRNLTRMVQSFLSLLTPNQQLSAYLW